MDCTYHINQRKSKNNEQASFQGGKDALKPHSTHTTFKWLDQNYHLEDNVCLPRCTIYEHYQDFCERNFLQPVNAASFGKIVRQHFPTLTTRRLGTRGQSKYHYYGLGIKTTSEYHTPDYVEKVKQGSQKKTSETRKVTSLEKPSTTLPAFPDVSSLMLADTIPIDKLKTFMVMYRAHCQRILDSVVRANFNEVENFLLHFWQGMPSHMLPVLGSEVVVDLVAYCDTLLYKVICNVLITSPLQNLPESLAGEYRTFSDMLRQWMEVALKGLPESLQEAKYKVAEGFINGLRRQTSLTKLAQVAQSELRNSNSLDQLRQDWDAVDFQSVFAQTLYCIQPMKIPMKYCNLLPKFLQRFSNLLHEETGLEQFLSFAEQMVQDAVEKGTGEDFFPLKDACQAFLLSWKFFNTKILEEFTMENAPSFGFFILLHMLLDDYIAHLLETKLEKEDEKIYYKRIHCLRKQDVQISSSSCPTRDNSSSDSTSPLQSPEEEVSESFDAGIVMPTMDRSHKESATSHISVKHMEAFQSPTPLGNMFPGLTNNFRSTESSSSLSLPVPSTHSSFIPPITSTSSLLHSTPPSVHAPTKAHADFASLGNFPTPLTMPDMVGERTTRSSIQVFQPSTSVLRQSGDHMIDFNVSQANVYSSTTQASQSHEQSSILQVVPQQSLMPSSLKPNLPHCTSFSAYSMSSTTPTFITQSAQILPSCSLPISTPTQSYSSNTSHHQQQQQQQQQHFAGQQQQQQQQQHSSIAAAPGIVSELSNTPTAVAAHSLPSNMVGRSLPNLSGFTALNVPYSHSNASTTTLSGSNSLSLFPTVQGMYPYTQFVGIPAPLNNPFTPAGLQMPGTQNQMPTGYPYIANVPHSLYNPQISTTTYSR